MPLRRAPGVRPEFQRSQTQRIITRAQRQILGELSTSQRQTLRESGFTPRPVQITVDPTQKAAGWDAPGPPVVAGVGGPERRTIVRVTSQGQPVRAGRNLLGEPVKPILRHEIGHQILTARGVPTGQHHRLQEPRGSAAGLRRLERLSVPHLRRIEKRIRTPRTQIQQAPKPSGGTASGFSTPHLREVAKTGTSTQQTRAREQMRRLGRRLRTRGVDF